MLKRDFTKSNTEYFRKNRNILIAIGVFLVIGILVFAIFGMNGNFEISGYNEFSITVGEKKAEDYHEHNNSVGKIINSHGGKFDTLLIHGDGDDTKYIVRYLDDINETKILEINKLVAEEVGVDLNKISSHTHVNGSVTNADYVYTAVAILLLVVIASIFAYARYNGASAMSVIIACLLGTFGFISIGSILRLSIGMNYFALLVILNLMIIYVAINLFESMHNSSWLVSRDYSAAMENALKTTKFRISVVGIGLLLIGLLLVLIAPITIKYVAVNVMFMAVTVLAVGWFVVPFVWNVFITRCKQRRSKVKASDIAADKISK